MPINEKEINCNLFDQLSILIWPFGCFTRYTLRAPLMAMRAFHKV